MTAMVCPVRGCGAATEDGLPCFDCTNRLLSDLRMIAELWPAILERRVTGEPLPSSGGGSVGYTPMPAARVADMDAIRNTLSTWMRDLGADVPDDVPAWCDWLTRHVPEVRSHEAAAELYQDISACWHAVTRLVDVPPDLVLVGFCPVCDDWLYAKPGADEVVCRKCKRAGAGSSKIAVGDARATMLDDARQYRGTPVEVSRLVGVAEGTLRGWVRKGWLDADGAGHVEVGQALLLTETMAERVEQARKVG